MQADLFKNVVEEITDLERKEIIPLLIDCLRYKTKDSIVTSKHLAGYLKSCGYPICDARVRKVLAYASAANIKQGKEENLGDRVIIACGKGYYVTSEIKDVEDLLDDLDRRRKNIDFRMQGVQAQLLNLKHKKAS